MSNCKEEVFWSVGGSAAPLRAAGQRAPGCNTVDSKISPCFLWGWGEEMDEIQLEVSEWTLPGPSVGDVTDEGVGASCQPPFVLMPCGLYIWLAARLSLYPPVWLITWRRVSTC